MADALPVAAWVPVLHAHVHAHPVTVREAYTCVNTAARQDAQVALGVREMCAEVSMQVICQGDAVWPGRQPKMGVYARWDMRAAVDWRTNWYRTVAMADCGMHLRT